MEKDIEKAYLAEQEYLKDTDPNKIALIDRIKEFGYETLEEYFIDKREYLLHKLNLAFVHHLAENSYNAVYSKMEAKEPALLGNEDTVTWAWVGSDGINEEKAKELDVKIVKMGYQGGTIITDSNDFNCSFVCKDEIDISTSYFNDKFVKYFNSLGINCYIDRNDIMLEGKKVAGGASLRTNGMCLYFVSIALSDHLDLIKQLCTKEMKKIPGYISGVTKKQLEEEFESWLSNIQ